MYLFSISFSQCLLLNNKYLLIKLYRKPFLKERTSDDSTHADSIVNLLTELGMCEQCAIVSRKYPYWTPPMKYFLFNLPSPIRKSS